MTRPPKKLTADSRRSLTVWHSRSGLIQNFLGSAHTKKGARTFMRAPSVACQATIT